MAESTDLLSKRAAMKGIESAMNVYMKRVEQLAAEYQELGAEIQELENISPEVPK
jgi:prefoldin subunit 5